MADNLNSDMAGAVPVDESLIGYTHIMYALHAVSALTGATIVLGFICGVPSIIAVIMNYARASAARGTFLESHFRWQIRTFWFAVFWSLVIVAISLPLTLVLVGFGTMYIGFVALVVWIIYRVARGWLALRDRRPMYI
jgi:uncharacterized membrane protein